MGAIDGFQPQIMAFCCQHCAYAAADLAGVLRFQYPANVRVIQIPCSGKLDVVQVLGNPFFPESFCSDFPGQLRNCVHTSDCSIRGVWSAVEEALRRVLQGISLADLTRSGGTAEVRFDAMAPAKGKATGHSGATQT